MKKIVYATLTAATLFAAVGAASAQTMYHQWNAHNLALNTGGASVGYNEAIVDFDAYK